MKRVSLRSLRFNYLSPYLIWSLDVFLSTVSTLFSFLFLNYLVHIDVNPGFTFEMLLVSAVAGACFTWALSTFRGIIRHATVDELARIVYAMACKDIVLLAFLAFAYQYLGTFIIAVAVGDFVVSVFLMMSFRALVVNFYYNIIRLTGKNAQNTLIYGTSEAAISLENYLRNVSAEYNVLGFVTRDSKQDKGRILGRSVYFVDSRESIEALFDKLKVSCLLYVNNADLHADEQMLNVGLDNHVQLSIAPLSDVSSFSTAMQLRNVQIEDLLGREEIKINIENIARELRGNTIMVTGAAGSIGSELCRQLCAFELKHLVVLDFSETATYQIDMELHNKFPHAKVTSVIADVRNKTRMETMIRRYEPDIIFHAAAYKHVPMMEEYPCEAVLTNVQGTRNVADLAVQYGIRKFIMISTDKAVRPSSVMGASKRLAEMYVQSLGAAIREGRVQGVTSFVTTRFGNVLGSNGSVIPLFRKQIMNGGPVTVTHPDIIRYFMTIPEACRLVLEAAFMGKDDEIFIFDMGQPVKIADLARRMIELSGLRPGIDIDIEFTGLRPGEKLFEELLYQKELTKSTSNPKIFRAQCVRLEYDDINLLLSQLTSVAKTDEKLPTVRMMKEIVSDYKSQHSVYSTLDVSTSN